LFTNASKIGKNKPVHFIQHIFQFDNNGQILKSVAFSIIKEIIYYILVGFPQKQGYAYAYEISVFRIASVHKIRFSVSFVQVQNVV